MFKGISSHPKFATKMSEKMIFIIITAYSNEIPFIKF